MDQEQKTEMKKREAENVREKEMVDEAKMKVEKPEIKIEDDKVVEKKLEDSEKKEEPKKVIAGSEKSKIVKKTEAVVNGLSLPVSTKHAVAVCDFIRGKNIEKAISELEKAKKKEIAIPMKGEIPHRKGKGMMSGRYPVKTIGEFIKLLKSLKSNAIANELELEKVRIFCVANKASRQYKRFGSKRFKRTHVEIKLVPITKKAKKLGVKK